MDNFDEIKNIWQTHRTERLPSISNINNAIKGYQATKKKNIIYIIFLAIICLFAMIWVVVDYQSNLWTTRIGEALFILMSIYLFYSKLMSLKRSKQEELLSAKNYLDDLKEKTKKEAINESQPILFIILSFAFFFYVYEMLAANKTQLIAGYCILFFFLVFMWFVYRPIKIKRQQTKIKDLLNKIDSIKNQTNEKD
ncbi:MAG: hypothetical protein H6557_26090 [Lewinellaceae bacterium]|nr:hypothetical protein [Phaeodactylibacter sp.]MCB9040108.1 hypothetical protein [Lewinellaceae bacterium]